MDILRLFFDCDEFCQQFAPRLRAQLLSDGQPHRQRQATLSTSEVMTILARNFSLSERHQLQFRADFLNLPNNVRWAAPSTDPSNTNFGKATAQRNAPRLIQFQLRYSF